MPKIFVCNVKYKISYPWMKVNSQKFEELAAFLILISEFFIHCLNLRARVPQHFEIPSKIKVKGWRLSFKKIHNFPKNFVFWNDDELQQPPIEFHYIFPWLISAFCMFLMQRISKIDNFLSCSIDKSHNFLQCLSNFTIFFAPN